MIIDFIDTDKVKKENEMAGLNKEIKEVINSKDKELKAIYFTSQEWSDIAPWYQKREASFFVIPDAKEVNIFRNVQYVRMGGVYDVPIYVEDMKAKAEKAVNEAKEKENKF